ncbi:MAG: CPBP family intramembrane metalloprotease [Ruminococcus sp.]|nr:CPBP family intramembrane metalloprotease [Candidatus Copronaster equi]
MKADQSRKITMAYNIALAMIAVRFLDVFILNKEQTIVSENFLGELLGLLACVVLTLVTDFSIRKNCFSPEGMGFDILFGVFISFVPLILDYAAELIYFKIVDYNNVGFRFHTPNWELFEGTLGMKIVAIGIFFSAILIKVLFSEIFFRGYMIVQISEKYRYPITNVIQATAYTLTSVPDVAFAVYIGEYANLEPAMIWFTVGSIVVNKFFSGVKWGVLYRANANIWTQVVDHFITDIFLTSVLLSPDRLPAEWIAINTSCVQIVSCFITMSYFYRKDRFNKEVAEEIETGMELMAAVGFEDGEPEEDENSISLSQFRQEVKKANPALSSDFNRGFVDNDNVQSKLTKQYFEDLIEKSSYTSNAPKLSDEAQKIQSDNAAGISKLIKDYFDEDFEKNTFTDG